MGPAVVGRGWQIWYFSASVFRLGGAGLRDFMFGLSV
jgi:hypothetical protein